MKRQVLLLTAGILLAVTACGGSTRGGSQGGADTTAVTAPASAGTLPAAPDGVDKLPLGDRPDSPPVEVDPSKIYLVDALHTAFTLKPPAAGLMAAADATSGSVVSLGPANGDTTYLLVLDGTQLRAFDDPYVPTSDLSSATASSNSPRTAHSTAGM